LGKNEKGKQEEGKRGKGSAEICVICGKQEKGKRHWLLGKTT